MKIRAFRLDLAQGCLWQGPAVVGLRPRSLALLCYLVEHPKRLVTKAGVAAARVGGTHGSDTVLRVCVQEIRAALGTAAAVPAAGEMRELCSHPEVPGH